MKTFIMLSLKSTGKLILIGKNLKLNMLFHSLHWGTTVTEKGKRFQGSPPTLPPVLWTTWQVCCGRQCRGCPCVLFRYVWKCVVWSHPGHRYVKDSHTAIAIYFFNIIAVYLISTKLHIFSLYNLMNLDLYMHFDIITTNKVTNIHITSKRLTCQRSHLLKASNPYPAVYTLNRNILVFLEDRGQEKHFTFSNFGTTATLSLKTCVSILFCHIDIIYMPAPGTVEHC